MGILSGVIVKIISVLFFVFSGQTLEEAGYTKFSGGEPNNSTEGEYCGSVYRTALYNDLWCENHYAFICEKKTDYPKVCDSASFSLDVRMGDSGTEPSEIAVNENIISGKE